MSVCCWCFLFLEEVPFYCLYKEPKKSAKSEKVRKFFVRVLNAVFSFPRLASIDCKLVVDSGMNRMNHLRLFVCPEINV
jgi:hypothetical protein